MLTRVFYHNEIHLSPLYTFLLEPSHVTASQAQPYFVTILHFVGYILSQIDSEQKLSAIIANFFMHQKFLRITLVLSSNFLYMCVVTLMLIDKLRIDKVFDFSIFQLHYFDLHATKRRCSTDLQSSGLTDPEQGMKKKYGESLTYMSSKICLPQGD